MNQTYEMVMFYKFMSPSIKTGRDLHSSKKYNTRQRHKHDRPLTDLNSLTALPQNIGSIHFKKKARLNSFKFLLQGVCYAVDDFVQM